MSLRSFIEAMPKIELNVQLEGSFEISRLLFISEQYEIPETLKHYNDWVGLIRKPDYARLYDILRVANSWVRDGDDLSRLAYDLATKLHKQRVRYAEVGVCPAYYPDCNLDFEGFFAAINDGRQRAERAWGIRMQWILNTFRDEPRRVEDTVRWGSSIPAQRAGVIGVGLIGRDDLHSPAQFEKPFRSAEKRELVRVVRVGELTGRAGISDTLASLNPSRILDARELWEDDDVMAQVVQQSVLVSFSPSRLIKQKWIENSARLPIRKLLDRGVKLTVSSDQSTLYQTSLNQEYILAAEADTLSSEEITDMALTAITHSALPIEEKESLRQAFLDEIETLVVEHLTPEGK
ncbi:MAG: hypothetical protein L6Q98_08035 [Anaerolineae bacterium]|nr:hypothetical protein [Anaerolineae bacterium]NUQ02539.1 hypothetical protein [Anaerolineae bacterium]